MASNDNLNTIAETARRLRQSETTIRRIVRDGRLRAVKLTAGSGSSRVLIPDSAIERLLAECVIGGGNG